VCHHCVYLHARRLTCFTQPHGANELKTDSSLAATQKEELKAMQYNKAFPAMPAGGRR
jgi:hypothetical protein